MQMNIDEAVRRTQDLLANEGDTMAELIGNFRKQVPITLVDGASWQRLLECADQLPIMMGSLPFGFELPLHESKAIADLGVSLASSTRAGDFFVDRARRDTANPTAHAVARLFQQMEGESSLLRDIVGRKVILEWDVGSSKDSVVRPPGMFLRPEERPIVGTQNQFKDVATVVQALEETVGWERDDEKRKTVEHAHLAQPADTRMDSFGVFPSRNQAIRLAVMGFRSTDAVCSYLQTIAWPGQIPFIESVISRFRERTSIARTGVYIDVEDEGIGPTLGLTFIVNQRYAKESRYWLDGMTDWDPVLAALRQEAIIVAEKIDALAKWVSPPKTLYGKAGRYVMLRGIHHIKLVVSDNQLQKVKAYVFIVLSGAMSD